MDKDQSCTKSRPKILHVETAASRNPELSRISQYDQTESEFDKDEQHATQKTEFVFYLNLEASKFIYSPHLFAGCKKTYKIFYIISQGKCK